MHVYPTIAKYGADTVPPDLPYLAVLHDDETIHFSGEGRTPEEAVTEFAQSGDLLSALEWDGWKVCEKVPVMVYTWVTPDKSDWPPDEIGPDWSFVLDKKITTIEVDWPGDTPPHTPQRAIER